MKMAFYVMYSPYDFDRIAETKPDNFTNAKGNHECVEFVRQTTGAPSTHNWRPGKLVKGAADIPAGTAIATFKGSSYSSHAAIYLRQDDIGIWVLDQWNKQGKVARRHIRFPRGEEKSPVREQNNGDVYYVIDTQETEKASREAGEPSAARVL
jgi:hypothetical protein